jgi:hypothetical protein
VTARLNLDCHLLNHPIRARLFQDQLEEDKLAKKPVLEQVLSRRKDHTVPTRWSLYRPLIRDARKLDNLLASIANTEKDGSSTQDPPLPIAITALTKYGCLCNMRQVVSLNQALSSLMIIFASSWTNSAKL